MKLSASGFSNVGTHRKNNQDSILIQDQIPESGSLNTDLSGNARFFVADGVGGAPAGEVASDFVLTHLNKKIDANTFPNPDEIERVLFEINFELFNMYNNQPQLTGMATTLSGLFISNNQYRIVNVGDSRVLLLRDGKLEQLTKDDILEVPFGPSPITNFFGGKAHSLFPYISPDPGHLENGDIFLVSTDGIFRSFSLDHLEKILSNSKAIHEKAQFILNKSLTVGAPDNISCIFIEITK